MKTMLFISMFVSVLGSSAAFANYDGAPYHGIYSTYDYGASRFYDVQDRYNGR
jgi:hypothetical protein